MKNTIPASLAAAINLIQGEHSPDGLAIIFPWGGSYYLTDLCWLDELCALMESEHETERANAVGIWINSCGPLTGFARYASQDAAQSADLDRILTEQQAERSNEPNTPVVAVIHAPEWAFPQPQQERLLDGLEASGYWSAYSDDLEAIAETLTADMGGFYGWRVDICLECIGKCAKSDRYIGIVTASIVG